jgi:hypothetical protein
VSRRSIRSETYLLLIIAAACAAPCCAFALPEGRAWTPVDTLKIPGHTWVAPLWMTTDASKTPLAVVEAAGGIGQEMSVIAWKDSAWVVQWTGGFPTGLVWPSLSQASTHQVLWKGIETVDTPMGGVSSYLVIADYASFLGDRDTLGIVDASSTEYSAADSHRRRWVVVGDAGNLRLLYSDDFHQWLEPDVAGYGLDGVAVAPLDDTTAVIAWGGLREGLRWGLLEGNSWNPGVPLDSTDQLVNRPRFRSRPSGGVWLAWGTGSDQARNHLPIKSFKNGTWGMTQFIPCPAVAGAVGSSSPDLSQDDSEYPSVVWIATDVSGTGAESMCVCMATDSGFAQADNLPYSGLPTIARDLNGDIWLAWWTYFDGMFWLHTYNRAQASRPRVERYGHGRRISWKLSEPAPETWWGVMRSRGDGQYNLIARVRAGPALEQTWVDSEATDSLTIYKIRRESVDSRYQVESPEAEYIRSGGGLGLSCKGRMPLEGRCELRIENAAPGPVEIAFFDLQGRTIARQEYVSGGMGEDSILLDLTTMSRRGLQNGVYFVAARDATGSQSNTIKAVVIR